MCFPLGMALSLPGPSRPHCFYFNVSVGGELNKKLAQAVLSGPPCDIFLVFYCFETGSYEAQGSLELYM